MAFRIVLAWAGLGLALMGGCDRRIMVISAHDALWVADDHRAAIEVDRKYVLLGCRQQLTLIDGDERRSVQELMRQGKRLAESVYDEETYSVEVHIVSADPMVLVLTEPATPPGRNDPQPFCAVGGPMLESPPPMDRLVCWVQYSLSTTLPPVERLYVIEDRGGGGAPAVRTIERATLKQQHRISLAGLAFELADSGEVTVSRPAPKP